MKKASLIEALLDEGYTDEEIIVRTKTTRDYVWRIKNGFHSVPNASGTEIIQRAKQEPKIVRASSPWKDEKNVELLLQEWRLGRSAQQIADRVNREGRVRISRNAVIGKLHRLGHTTRDPMVTRSRINGKKPKVKKGFPPRDTMRMKLARLPVEPLPPPSETDVARKQLIELQAHECRWPVGHVGEEGFGFCAQPKVPGLPYCENHARRAFQPIQPRRREPVPPVSVGETKVTEPA